MPDSPYRRVTVAIDQSPGADAAIDFALTIAGANSEVTFIHAADRATTIANYIAPHGCDIGALESMKQLENELFKSACKRAAALGIKASGQALEGYASRAIVDYVRSSGVDAVVVGIHADHGIARSAVGSVSEAVLRTAGIPTFVCQEARSVRSESRIRRILVGIDASEPSKRAIECAIALALWTDADIEFANVLKCDFARRSSDREVSISACVQASRAGVQAHADILHGPTADTLAAAAARYGADLIVVGTHGRFGRARLRYGSVAEAVVRSAGCPVMVVPANRAEACREHPVDANTAPIASDRRAAHDYQQNW